MPITVTFNKLTLIHNSLPALIKINQINTLSASYLFEYIHCTA